ncbi:MULTISPECIES: MaoC family dehydratase N-terminal domain-containing protein [unclassified Pseudonocardia]|uniref:FAS1-like dehydratase domain-containing protein n=1 Tax=unclassified Pseudonocardia TaxID=2619320 RepID=UPI000B28C28A|nr:MULTISPECIES: MaoC family dehydratase N-terminal domain-containing protein [unclassified Pseudonocardia]
MDDLSSHLTGWAPAPVETAGRIDACPTEAFAGLLDQPSPGTGEGDPLPPMWHWFHLLAHPAQADLGEDGHPAHGAFLPPLPDRRRMFAGGRLQVREPLRIGDEVTRRSSLVSVTPKTGRSGAMVFVTEQHEYRRAGVVALIEEQDYAYRSQPAGSVRGLAPEAPVAAEPEPTGGWRARIDPDPRMLFRFSALTYNTHRIHYDQPYVTGVEGYPGLVVHGPLLALLLLELPRRFAPERQVAGFSYRLRSPAFAGVPIVADGDVRGELAAGVPGQPASVTGTVGFLE